MIMMLPFLLGIAAILCVFARRRKTAIAVWALMLAVLVAWLLYHMTTSLNLAF